MDSDRIAVQTADFDPGAEIELLGHGQTASGALVSFIGLVRGGEDGVTAMTLEHYPGMTEKQIAAIILDCRRRWPVDGITVIHRTGRLRPGERIVFVGVTAPHRGEAFQACEFLMDWLKTRAPFWKLEETADGQCWVAAKDQDDARADRW